MRSRSLRAKRYGEGAPVMARSFAARCQYCFRNSGPSGFAPVRAKPLAGGPNTSRKFPCCHRMRLTAPPCMMASLFVTPRIPIRWVMMMTVVLAAFIHSMASKSTRSPSVVQAGVRLVENHEVRVAEERPCKAEPLAKPAREIGASAQRRPYRTPAAAG